MQNDKLFDGRYRLISEKGRGAFGEVWLAHDEQTDLNVAVKIYIALDDKGIDEFRSEYKTAYALNHPNLLHANYFDIVENRPFLVMPYCPESAESLIGTTDEGKIWKFIKDVASGLSYLHSKNILHRDIKPDNILADVEENYVITDFGVSTKMKSTLRRNSTRAMTEKDMSGTIGYMAPELFSKTPEAVKATDIWAFGATLFEIINGELPFYGQGGVMLEHGAEIPELKGNWSEALRQTVEACLAKDPWNRPTAEQLEVYAAKCASGKIDDASWAAKSSASEPSKGKVDVPKVEKANKSEFPLFKGIVLFGCVICVLIIVVLAYKPGTKTNANIGAESANVIGTNSQAASAINAETTTVIDGLTWMNYNVGAGNDFNLQGYVFSFYDAQSACPSGFRLPTKKELESLALHSTWATYKGVTGRWFSGSLPYSENTPAIFLPTHPTYGYGAYWSSTTGGEKAAYNLGFRESRVGFYGSYRHDIFSVRCVKK